MNTTIERKPVAEGRELSLDELDTVAGGGSLCIGVSFKSVCVGIGLKWLSS